MIPLTSKVAGRIAIAAFFAPPIVTSPINLVLPSTTNLSKINSPLIKIPNIYIIKTQKIQYFKT